MNLSLQSLWEKAVQCYRQGQRGSSTYFNEEETRTLDSFGVNAQEVYDYAEDFVNGGEPDLDAFLRVHEIRHHYFLKHQNGKRSPQILDPQTLPARDAEARGVRWLPRIIPKAKAKLRGELHPEIMYGCGGDRKFLRENGFHPAEFLQLVADHETDDAAIIQAVVDRKR